MYDYYLGGKDNYTADREAARRTFAVLGEDVVRGTVLQNRAFLGRAVRYLAAELTYTGDWHPAPDTLPASAPGGSSIWCGIARKP